MSTATDDRLRALVAKWRGMAAEAKHEASATDDQQGRELRAQSRVLLYLADELAALLASPVEATRCQHGQFSGCSLCHGAVSWNQRDGRVEGHGASPVEAEPPLTAACRECGGRTGGGAYCYEHAPYLVTPKADGSWISERNGLTHVWQAEPSPNEVALRAEVARLERDIQAYRGALGYAVPGNYDGRLRDGTVPQCGLCGARGEQPSDGAAHCMNTVCWNCAPPPPGWLMCPFCLERWDAHGIRWSEWASCPRCGGSFSYRRPREIPAPDPSQEPEP